MNEATTLAHFASAVKALPEKRSELRRLWLEAAETSEALSAAAQAVTLGSPQLGEAEWTCLEEAAYDAEHALRDFLLTEHGLTTADLNRSVL